MTDPGSELIITGGNDDTLDVNVDGWTQTSITDNGTNTTYEYSQDGSSDSISITVDDEIITTGM